MADIKCIECGHLDKQADPKATTWDCACGSSYVLRRCLACGVISQVSSLQRNGQPWVCMWCHAASSGFSKRGDPAQATVGDLADDVARHGLSLASARREGQVQIPMLIVTMNEIPGYRITEVHGDVFGLFVRARNVFSSLGVHLRAGVGGEVGAYTKVLIDSRNRARERMWQEARARGANAVIAMRFDCNEIGDIMSEVSAYGTAVTVEPLEPQDVSFSGEGMTATGGGLA